MRTALLGLAIIVSACDPAAGQGGAPDTTYAALITALSEPGGYFDTDNLISNESSYLHVLGALDSLGVEGGAYLGVGPDQSFSYIAALRPAIAFIVDIRRDNLLQHLWFRALFETAPSRLDYLCLMVVRQCGGGSDGLAVAALDAESPTTLAEYSNACGVAMDYCLAAPGTVIATGTDDPPDDPLDRAAPDGPPDHRRPPGRGPGPPRLDRRRVADRLRRRYPRLDTAGVPWRDVRADVRDAAGGPLHLRVTIGGADLRLGG